jgi:hypothetical protein
MVPAGQPHRAAASRLQECILHQIFRTIDRAAQGQRKLPQDGRVGQEFGANGRVQFHEIT